MRFLVLLVLLLGCGSYWDLDQPIAVQMADFGPQTANIRSRFESAVNQLGGTVGSSVSQIIQIVYDAECSCSDCSVSATSGYSQGTVILICPLGVFDDDVVAHEFGHALGAGHVECPSGGKTGIMAAEYDCHMVHGQYQPVDLKVIKDTGHVIGGVF